MRQACKPGPTQCRASIDVLIGEGMTTLNELRDYDHRRKQALKALAGCEKGSMPCDIFEGRLSKDECWRLVKQGIIGCKDNRYYVTLAGKKLLK